MILKHWQKRTEKKLRVSSSYLLDFFIFNLHCVCWLRLEPAKFRVETVYMWKRSVQLFLHCAGVNLTALQCIKSLEDTRLFDIKMTRDLKPFLRLDQWKLDSQTEGWHLLKCVEHLKATYCILRMLIYMLIMYHCWCFGVLMNLTVLVGFLQLLSHHVLWQQPYNPEENPGINEWLTVVVGVIFEHSHIPCSRL